MEPKFNPSSPGYKKVEDLPQEHQAEFVDIEDDFVKKEAVENKEKAMVAREEVASPEIAEIIACLREFGYLDTSFEGREVHPLAIRPLTKEQALDEYRNSGGETLIQGGPGGNMLYTIPQAETLDVMIMNFGKEIKSDEALAEMDRLSVRPLTYEELIQYGVAHPSHQKHHSLLGLGTKYTLGDIPEAVPILGVFGGARLLSTTYWGYVWNDKWSCFPVVRK